VARPDHHLLIEKGHILVKRGPKENRFRPSIDALFRSAAYSYGTGVIGLIMTGMLDDGTSGMWSIKRLGGITIVQDPADALFSSMPFSVMEHVEVDHISSLSKISQLLVELTYNAMEPKHKPSENEVRLLKMEIDIAALENAFDKGITKVGEPSLLTCPECGGALTTLREGKLLRYRCHTGHAYSSATLLSEVTETAEHKLWAALRSLEEAVMIVEKQAAASCINGDERAELNYRSSTKALKARADELRNFLNQYLEYNLEADM
jgi:two-component system chemotaxis response regulator CheB